MSDEQEVDAVDHDTYVTPEHLAKAVGPWDLDPATNERSHIVAQRTCMLEKGQDGLVFARYVSRNTRVWINPPFSRGNVLRFVRAYRHTRFCFLVRVDSSTAWWSELWPCVNLMCIPWDRVEFEPPPGIEDPPGVRFPHALLYARAEDATAEVRRLCYVSVPDHS